MCVGIEIHEYDTKYRGMYADARRSPRLRQGRVGKGREIQNIQH